LARSAIARRLSWGVGANVVDKLMVSGTQLLTVAALSSAWGLHVYGVWVLLATVPTFLAMGDLGFASAAGVKMAMARARGHTTEVIAIFHSAWVAILASSTVLATLCIAVSLLAPIGFIGIGSALSDFELRTTLLLLLFYGLVIVQGSILFAALRCNGRYAAGAFWHAGMIVLECVLVLVTVHSGGGPALAAAALLAGRIGGVLGQGMLLRLQVPWLRLGFAQASWKEVRSLIAPAGAVMALPLGQALALQGSAVMLGLAAGPAAVPAFTVARTLSRIGLQLCGLFNTALMPEASAVIARADRVTLAAMVLATMALSIALAWPFALLFALYGQEAVAAWSHGVIAVPDGVVSFMAVGMAAGGVWFPLSNLLLAANRPESYTFVYAALAVLTLPTVYVLARGMGAAGAALALGALDVLMAAIILVLASRILVGPRELLEVMERALTRLAAVRSGRGA